MSTVWFVDVGVSLMETRSEPQHVVTDANGARPRPGSPLDLDRDRGPFLEDTRGWIGILAMF